MQDIRTKPQRERLPIDPMPDVTGVLEAVPVAVLVVDGAGVVLAANGALRSMLGIEDADVMGRRARFLSPSPGWQRVWELLCSGPDDRPARIAFESGSGERRHLEIRVGAGGQLGTVVVTIQDCTAIRLLRQRVGAQAKVLATARTQLRAARDELLQADARFVELVSELEQATAAAEGDEVF